MKCPKCKGKTKVLDSRRNPSNNIRRRRKCVKCSYRFSTIEILKIKKEKEIPMLKTSEKPPSKEVVAEEEDWDWNDNE
jgi:transcriptional regulator NrdR family protein